MCALPFSVDDVDTQPLHDQKSGLKPTCRELVRDTTGMRLPETRRDSSNLCPRSWQHQATDGPRVIGHFDAFQSLGAWRRGSSKPGSLRFAFPTMNGRFCPAWPPATDPRRYARIVRVPGDTFLSAWFTCLAPQAMIAAGFLV